MTWPLALHLGDHVPSDLGDPLYNIWVMAWNRHAHLAGEGPAADANIFAPHTKTLYFADPIYGLSALGAVVRVVSPNDVFAYNVLFLLSFVFSAGGMYALVFHLTRRRTPAAVAGIIFAFCPYRFAHFSHLELLYAGWIPVGLLFLHRFFTRKRWLDLAGFTAAYVLQALFCAYYAVSFTIFAGLFIGASVIGGRLWGDRSLWLKAGVFAGLCLVLLGPVFLPFVGVHESLLFTRGQDVQTWLHYSADLTDYLAVPPVNRLWRGLMGTSQGPEWQLFPGAIATALAAAGLAFRDRRKKPSSPVDRRKRFFRRWDIANFAFLTVVYGVIEAGGATLKIAGIKIFSLHRYENPLIFLGLSVALRVVLGWRRSRVPPSFEDRESRPPAATFYLALTGLAFVLSLGPVIQAGGKTLVRSPLALLDAVLGDFRGIRVLSRFGLIVVLGIAVLAGFGMKAILRRLGSHRTKAFVAAGLGFLCLVESASLPLPLAKVPVGPEIPLLYDSVRNLAAGSVLIELPMPQVLRERSAEALRMYYSTTHWKKLVNGYSGYFPPDYEIIREAMEHFPSEDTFDLLRDLNVDYVLVHTLGYRAKKGRRTVERMQALPDRLEVIDAAQGSYLFRVRHRPRESGPQPVLRRISDKHLWKARSGKNPSAARFAIDEDRATYWSTESPQNRGDHFELDLGAVRSLERIDLWLYPRPRHYPRGFVLSGSADGRCWIELRSDPSFTIRFPESGIHDYRSYKAEISFLPAEVRFLRFVLSGRHHRPWSISEIDCWDSSRYNPVEEADPNVRPGAR